MDEFIGLRSERETIMGIAYIEHFLVLQVESGKMTVDTTRQMVGTVSESESAFAAPVCIPAVTFIQASVFTSAVHTRSR